MALAALMLAVVVVAASAYAIGHRMGTRACSLIWVDTLCEFGFIQPEDLENVKKKMLGK